MPTRAFVLCYLVITMVFMTGPLSLAAESELPPSSISWGSFDSEGSTAYGVYNSDNITPLQPGCLAQLIWAGPDGRIDPPMGNGLPSGDDELFDTSTVTQNNSLPPTMRDKGYISFKNYTYQFTGTDDPRLAGVIYIRAWSAPAAGAAVPYGDSTTGVLMGATSQQWRPGRWYTPSVPTAVDLAYFTATSRSNHVLLEWETTMELNIIGFDLQRGVSSDGPWQTLNPLPIPTVSPGSVEGHAYSWIDTLAPRGRLNYYRLAEVLLDGGSKPLAVTSVYYQGDWRLWLPILVR